MEISDEEIVLKAWEVQVRRGWDFVIDTLLRDGVSLFPPNLSEDQGYCEDLPGSTQQGTLSGSGLRENFDIFHLLTSEADADIPLPSQESGDEADEETTFGLSSNECGNQRRAASSWSGHDFSQTQSISHRSLPIVSKSTLNLKIQRFISEATRAYYDCFYSMEMMTDNMATAVPETLGTAVERLITRPVSGFILCSPLAAHVSKHLRLTVAALRYFDMFSLLPDSDKKRRKPSRRKSLVMWQRGFAVMASILLEDVPDQMKGLFDYGETIRKAHDNGPDGGWLLYDEQFRKLKEAHPDVSWAMVHSELWSELCNPAAAPAQLCKPEVAPAQLCKPEVAQLCKPEVAPAQLYKPAVAPAQLYKPAVAPAQASAVKNICFAYNLEGCFFGPGCFFKHICSGCGAEHPRVMCFELNPEEPALKMYK